MNNNTYLNDRVAIVTGGASGMGRAMALALAEKGANVAVGSLLDTAAHNLEQGEVVHRPSEDDLYQTRDMIEEMGVKAIAKSLDVCDRDSCKSFFEAAKEEFGHVDILANAAGITTEQVICGHDEALWLKVMDVNTNGTFRMIRLALPDMMAQGWGRIINIASTAASVGAPTSGAYCASKAAVVGLTRCVAQEGAERGVSCNSISPGWVATDFQKKWMTQISEDEGDKEEHYREQAIAENPQKRMVKPEEIGALAAFLCKEEALGITGQDLTVSAGSLW